MQKRPQAISVEHILEEPIRAAIFSQERLEEYASYLAENLKVEKNTKGSRPLLKRLKDNEDNLLSCYKSLIRTANERGSISPAGEWLIDNFHIIEDQIREIKKDLPDSYYKELPKISVGDLKGYPRIYAMALALVAHTDSRLEIDVIERFIQSFQKVAYLNMGELWAVPITLRLVLVENARRLSLRIIWDREQRLLADHLADKIVESSADPEKLKNVISAIPNYCGRSIETEYAFVAQLAKRLRDQRVETWSAVEVLEKSVSLCQCSIEQIVSLDHQRQAANQVTISNIILSMRLLSNVDWPGVFEKVSLLDQILAKDPTGDYGKMDFRSRDYYRHSLERIAKRTSRDEREVTQWALDMALHSQRHVGVYIQGDGVFLLEEHFKYRSSVKEGIIRLIKRYPTFFYLGMIFTLIVGFALFPIYYLYIGNAPWAYYLALAFILFIPLSDLSVSCVNFICTHIMPPSFLPKMDLSGGVPSNAKTLVVIPCLLSSEDTVRDLLEKLEVYFFANFDPHIFFALATDYVDSVKEHRDEDERLLNEIMNGIRGLNKKHGFVDEDKFFLFHRRRLWNPQEEVWMGWERKRGKLEELNRYLRGDKNTSYIIATCPQEIGSQFRYIITLDADTQLGRDAAKKLIGTALHPLQQPVYDEVKKRIVSGYGIIQPRISISLESSSRSLFAMIFSGHTGIDPYTTAVSDVYQDIFSEGSFTGKGLYEIDAFQKSLEGRVPENVILSHDLFEGLYARCALATDIELLDDYPKTYFSFFLRQHRWVRGDWQIARWMLPVIQNVKGTFVKNDLPWISRWKIYDNLRRSLVALGVVVFLFAGWVFLPGTPLVWTLLALVVVALPIVLHIAGGILVSPRGVPWTSHFWSEIGKARIHLSQFFLTLVFLVHQAFIQSDAIIRSCFRVYFSKKKCLEWVTAAQAESVLGVKRKPFWQKPWPVWTALFVMMVGVFAANSMEAIAVAAPFLILWSCYPWVARIIGRKYLRKEDILTQEESSFYFSIGRRIWHFFDTFVGPDDNWLPPDNVQEEPDLLVAHRTSPTNIGLYAMSIVAARDCGYLSVHDCVERLERLILSLKKLERHEGHLLNWYDTQTLQPLEPRYVSSVDSGNYAGYLLVLKESCDDFLKSSLFSKNLLSGLKVGFEILAEEIQKNSFQADMKSGGVSRTLLNTVHEGIDTLATVEVHSYLDGVSLIQRIHGILVDLDDSVHVLEQEYGARHYQTVKRWIAALNRQVQGALRDVRFFEVLVNKNEIPMIGTDIKDISLEDIPSFCRRLREDFASQFSSQELNELGDIEEHFFSLCESLNNIKKFCEEEFSSINFTFLVDRNREVFSIGFNVREGRHDNSFYDLLASESRLASFVAIAKGDISQKHWFRLGRQLVPVNGGRALVSWSASMFEYFMPLLVMKNYDGTLLHETLNAVVKRQISYGRKLKVPWGISEAGYNARDLNFNYQYGPFGIPGLGLKRGLGHDLVVAPYSTFLAAMIVPKTAFANLLEFKKMKLLGCYGFYESVDYTPERLSQDQKYAVIRSFMAHHQGMSLVAITNILFRNIIQKRFHSELRVKATQLLLQERIPQKVQLSVPKAAEIEWEGAGESLQKSFTRVYENPTLSSPRVQLLSNGAYSLMISTAGSGYSKYKNLAVSRWREDATRDSWGSYIFVQDMASRQMWSTSYLPFYKKPDSYKVMLADDKVEFWRTDGQVKTNTQIIVAPEDNIEIRQVTLVNESSEEKVFEITSYVEPVLASFGEDAAHPAFSNLFLQTDYLSSRQTLLVRRRPRSEEKPEFWGLHSVVTDAELTRETEYETDRSRFIGRGRTLETAVVLKGNGPLSKSLGSTLDPILSLRVSIKVPPRASKRMAFVTGIAESKDEILQLADRYHHIHSFDRESRLAWTKSQIDLRHLGLDSESAYLFQRLAERIIYLDPSLRQPSHVLAQNARDQASLWPYGISGDLPIVVLTVGDKKDLPVLRKLLRGHEYLRLRGLEFDLVVINNSAGSYLQEFHDEILQQVRSSGQQNLLNRNAGVFILRLDTIQNADKTLIQSMARVNLSAESGSLKEQLSRKMMTDGVAPLLQFSKEREEFPRAPAATPRLQFYNGLGGFTDDGKEYVIVLKEGQWTPAPWINVIANAHDFGFQVSESGAGFTWAVNSRENRLTPWSNDFVSDAPGEVIYIRDDETGGVWTPTPLPLRDNNPYVVRHGQGYTTFEHTAFGFTHELKLFVPKEDPVKIFHLKIKNISGKNRKISLFGYVEWVLGNYREKFAPHVFTEIHPDKNLILSKNSYNIEFAQQWSFWSCSENVKTFTCDRKEFIGRNGSALNPEGLRRQGMSSRSGMGLDPCGVLQIELTLDSQEERDLVFILGQGSSKDVAMDLVAKYRDINCIHEALQSVQSMWDQILTTIQVKTPDLATDFMLNRWLLYQALVCRMWARSAFYQSGGAFGFRDQLQDTMAFVYVDPVLARNHIIRAAGRQFLEGDVQHWWHPPTGRGVRTHFSDDLLWLPFVVSHYIKVTGDTSVLSEKVAYLEAPPLEPDQEDAYLQPVVSDEKCSLLDHCYRAINRSLKTGAHGLPLIGSGDWNDGMNKIGKEGRGESVWMGWFLHKVLSDFMPYCDSDHKEKYTLHMRKLKASLEEEAWDGAWYRRAFFDDGTPVGSAQNTECQIDSLAQTWSILSGAGDLARQKQAMQSVSERLILWSQEIILLLTPPFDKSSQNPGYIKGYVPGVRENGGQYTHAAIWVMMAYAQLGDQEKVGSLFNMLNPIRHGDQRSTAYRYKIEPYVVAADIYTVEPHVGRGGWSWYTGSASWLYRAGLESLLGFKLEGSLLSLRPCVPKEWREYQIIYKFKETTYKIQIQFMTSIPMGQILIFEGDKMLSNKGEVQLVNDKQTHQIVVHLSREEHKEVEGVSRSLDLKGP